MTDLAELTPIEYKVLDTIAEGESPGEHPYQTLYGGHKFKSTQQHPHIPIPIQGRPGVYSTAAGRYQINAPTWHEQSERLGLTDFSPGSQDQAAWDLARRTYHNKTGRDLALDQAQDKVDWGALAGRWPSLNRFKAQSSSSSAVDRPQAGIYPALENSAEFDSLLHPHGPSANALLPVADRGTDRNQGLSLLEALAPQYQFQPVDHDPFGASP